MSTDDSAIGLLVECPSCGQKMTVPGPAMPAPAASPVPPSPSKPSAEPAAAVHAFACAEQVLADPAERRAFAWVVVCSVPVLALLVVFTVLTLGGVLILMALLVLIRSMAERFAAAYIRTNAVRVSPRQLPALHRAVEAFAAVLGKPEPEVYVLQHSVWNAMAMRLARKRLVVLYSGAVDSLLSKGDMRQVAWLVGHELGHHYAGHLDFVRRLFAVCALPFPWVVLWYSRRCELTCDRYGLACAGSTNAALRALANMAVGSQLAASVDILSAIEQWERHRREFFVRYRTLYSTHPHTLWRIAETVAVARELNVPA
jgi:Zn-dependent protease with chaperone function